MTAINITIDGAERTVTDITLYRNDLANTARMLDKVYAGFDATRPDLLVSREEEIVKLYNRYQDLRAIVDQWDGAEKSRENILAGWVLVQQLREGGAP
ncbi:hypothetical protein ACM61V_02220 [Sphingomonas sp. TX0543]|uniref:hypothetical protein n=1 Tax=unclassified Sphingomonas TaxID=196159 RepID=UPI0010F6E030|nr:hypothetical protein [Sphingomonas sp. 3P27F8]